MKNECNRPLRMNCASSWLYRSAQEQCPSFKIIPGQIIMNCCTVLKKRKKIFHKVSYKYKLFSPVSALCGSLNRELYGSNWDTAWDELRFLLLQVAGVVLYMHPLQYRNNRLTQQIHSSSQHRNIWREEKTRNTFVAFINTVSNINTKSTDMMENCQQPFSYHQS